MLFAQREIQKELIKRNREIQEYVFYDNKSKEKISKTPRALSNSRLEIENEHFGNPNDLYSQAETNEVSPD